MPTVSTVELPITTKLPREAVAEWIRLLRSNVTDLEKAKIDLGLISMANNGVLVRLAERLPDKALGFSKLSPYRAKTAAEFLDEPNLAQWSFQGTLTEHMPPSKVLTLIEELLGSPAQAIRSTSFMANAANFHWKGAPADGSGSLHLFDFKGFNRKQRFSLTAGLKCPLEGSKSPEVQDYVKRVSASTGIPFHKGNISTVAEDIRDDPSRSKALLIGQICFDEAIEVAADEIRARSKLPLAPTALSHDRAFTIRAELWGGDSSGRVDLASVIKNVLKSTVPDLVFENSDGEAIQFTKRIAQNTEVLIIISRALPRLGKAFTVEIGVRSTKPGMAGFRFKTNVFRLERTTQAKCWVYSNRGEAIAVADKAVEVINTVLPVFESALRSYFDPWPEELPAQIQQRGSITARQALVQAVPLVRHQFPDAQLIRIVNTSRSLEVRDAEGSEVSIDGRLTLNGAWWLHFYSAAQDVSVEVNVPSVGRIRILDHGDQYQNPNTRGILVPIGEDWIDSDRAFAIAEEQGGRGRRGSGRMFGVSTKLHSPRSRPACWEIMYLVTDERGRNDLIVQIDAH